MERAENGKEKAKYRISIKWNIIPVSGWHRAASIPRHPYEAHKEGGTTCCTGWRGHGSSCAF
jgi:hypothetical protein